jgi:hypothetical protein
MLGGHAHHHGVPASTTNPVLQNEHSPPLPGDQLHEKLLNIFSHHVDPLIRLVHWPSFLERSRVVRQRRVSHMHASPISQYSNPYFPSASFDASQQVVFSNPSAVPSQGQELHPRSVLDASSDSAFLALLYSIYYAAVISIVDSPSPPDLGKSFSAYELAATFKREVTSRVLSLNESVASSESLEMLQALVLSLVRMGMCPFDTPD